MKRLTTYFSFTALLLGFIGLSGCAIKDSHYNDPELDAIPERLVVQGKVTNEDSQALEGIRVDIYGVRDENESDILSYNYALTDSEGCYTICRYMGRIKPKEVLVVASDPQKKYKEQKIATPAAYYMENSTNDLVDLRVDFVLTLLE